MTVIAVEDDKILRMLEVLFEPQLAPQRAAALADYCVHDGVDLGAWRVVRGGTLPGISRKSRWESARR